MSKSLTNIVNKFCVGEHLSDQELLDLRKHYDDLKCATQPFGERYVLVHIEAARNLHRIERFLYARNLRAPLAGTAEHVAEDGEIYGRISRTVHPGLKASLIMDSLCRS